MGFNESVGSVCMIKPTFEKEFAVIGVEGVREKVRQGAYDPETHNRALQWLMKRDPARKAWKNSKDTIQLARRASTQTRIAMGLSAVSVALLILTLYLLWRILEHVDKI